MNFIKSDYEQLLALLHRVEVKGIAEAQALLMLAQKLTHSINTPATAVAEPTPPPTT